MRVGVEVCSWVSGLAAVALRVKQQQSVLWVWLASYHK